MKQNYDKYYNIIDNHIDIVKNKPIDAGKIYVVIDFDDTIVHLTQLGYLYEYLLGRYCKNGSQSKLFTYNAWKNLLDDFPEVFRPHIFSFFKFLIKLRENGFIDKIVVYTNNNQGTDWINLNLEYLKSKITSRNGSLFLDDVIYCYDDSKGRRVDSRRTTSEKIYQDVFRILNVNPILDRIIFIDDFDYSSMVHPNIKQLLLKPHCVKFTKEEICTRYSEILGVIDKEMYNTMSNFVSFIEKRFGSNTFREQKLTKDELYNSEHIFREFTSYLTDFILEINKSSKYNSTSLNTEE